MSIPVGKDELDGFILKKFYGIQIYFFIDNIYYWPTWEVIVEADREIHIKLWKKGVVVALIIDLKSIR